LLYKFDWKTYKSQKEDLEKVISALEKYKDQFPDQSKGTDIDEILGIYGSIKERIEYIIGLKDFMENDIGRENNILTILKKATNTTLD
jgi:hypothetical protein